jgi:hypothetical protein
MLLPRIAGRDEKLAGLISLAGSARPLEDLVLAQFRYIHQLDGKTDEEEAAHLADLAEKVARVKDPKLAADTPAEKLPLHLPAAYWLDLRGYHPPTAAKALKQPMLILQGGRDYQVTRADYDQWAAALAGREDVTLKFYGGLNHLFMPGKGKPRPAEYEAAGHVAPEVVADIARWVKARGG